MVPREFKSCWLKIEAKSPNILINVYLIFAVVCLAYKMITHRPAAPLTLKLQSVAGEGHVALWTGSTTKSPPGLNTT